MNQVILIGRLTSDPELKFISTGVAISKFNLAIDRTYKKEGVSVTDFIPIEIWGKKAEYCAMYLGKGYLVVVDGSLHMDRYIDDSGQSRVFAKVCATTVTKLSVPAGNSDAQGSVDNSSKNNYNNNTAKNKSDNKTTSNSNSTDVTDDDDNTEPPF